MALRGSALLIALLCLTLIAGCAGLVPQTMALRSDWPRGVPWRHRIEGVPLVAQQDFQCGPAALASSMSSAGKPVTVDTLIRRIYLPARQGALQVEMQAAPRNYGLVSYPIAPNIGSLLREVAADHPVIVLQDRGFWPLSAWHYTVVTGYDYPAGELILHDGKATEVTMPFTVFEYLWKKSDYWALVILPPDQLPVTADRQSALRAIAPLEHLNSPEAATAVASAYRTYLRRWPDDVTAMIGLSNADYRQGRLVDAEAVLRQAQMQAPNDPAVLNNLAQVLSDLGRQAEAGALIERASRQGGSAEVKREIETTAATIRQRAAAENARSTTPAGAAH